jgi:hypothetical protein
VSVRSFALGATMSGKTYRLQTMFANRDPRVLVLDFVGNPNDWLNWPGAQVVWSARDVAIALREAASRSTWRIVWVCDPDNEAVAIARILQMLVPTDPQTPSFAQAVGGMSLVIDEVMEIMPNHQGKVVKKNSALWRKGRHRGLSIHAGTQKYADVSKTVTDMSRFVVVCPIYGARDVKSVFENLPRHVAEHAQQLAHRHCILWDRDHHRGALLDPDSKVVKAFGPTG